MGLLGWFTEHEANTQESRYPELAPLVVSLVPAQAFEMVRQAITMLPEWKIETESAGEFHLMRRGSFGRVLTMLVTLKAAGPGTMIHAVARGGLCCSGRNRRNILELFGAVRTLVT